jgi:simple sugar transport system ATP-binding protein
VNHAKALQGANFVIKQGIIQGLLGENAAGKSTLMKILCGVHQPDSGSILINGQRVIFHSPAEALKAGIGMVYQHFRLVEELSVLENIMLSVSEKGYKFIRKRAILKKITALLDYYGFKIDPHDKVNTLSVGEKQLVEITRILFLDVDVLIMDEPTAVLSEFEKEKLFSVIRQLKEQGKAIVFISHNLNEVIQLCDDITVFRKGRNSLFQEKGYYDKEIILREMLGGEYQHFSGTEFTGNKQQVLQVNDLNLVTSEGQLLSDINFELFSGHITGIAGFAGNGQLQLFETIFSKNMNYTGTVFYHGQDIRRWSVVEKREAGIAYIPEDRLFHGSALTLPLMYNLTANRLEKPPFSKWKMIDKGYVEQAAKELVINYDIDTLSVKIPIGLLSGGNIQKAVIARETHTMPALLLIHEPTRGLDSAAISFTYSVLNDLKHAGAAVLMASSNVEELMEVCDEIYVMYEGRFVHYAKKAAYDKQIINEHLAGFFEKHDERFVRKGNKYEA